MARVKTPTKRKTPELNLQIAVINEVKKIRQTENHPTVSVADKESLGLLYAVPNGLHTSGHQAFKAKAAGLRAGIPDLHLPVARGGFHGLWVELKTPSGRTSPAQHETLKQLEYEGHAVVVARTVDEAISAVLNYLAGKEAPRGRTNT